MLGVLSADAFLANDSFFKVGIVFLQSKPGMSGRTYSICMCRVLSCSGRVRGIFGKVLKTKETLFQVCGIFGKVLKTKETWFQVCG